MSTRPGSMPLPLDTAQRDMMVRVNQLLRGGFNLHDNMSKSHIVSYTHTSGAGSPQTVDISSMGLAWAPTYFLVVDIDSDATVYATAVDKGSWSTTQIVLTCSADNVALKVMVF